MTKSELQKMIQLEVQNAVRRELPQIVKPLVQEAVAGALANLLAEGIVKGVSKTQTNKPEPIVARSPRTVNGRLDESTKRRMASELGYGTIERIGEPVRSNSNNLVESILAETANDMSINGVMNVPSVLDSSEQMEAHIAPEAIAAMTRDYTELMQKLNEKRK